MCSLCYRCIFFLHMQVVILCFNKVAIQGTHKNQKENVVSLSLMTPLVINQNCFQVSSQMAAKVMKVSRLLIDGCTLS